MENETMVPVEPKPVESVITEGNFEQIDVEIDPEQMNEATLRALNFCLSEISRLKRAIIKVSESLQEVLVANEKATGKPGIIPTFDGGWVNNIESQNFAADIEGILEPEN